MVSATLLATLSMFMENKLCLWKLWASIKHTACWRVFWYTDE